MNPGPAHADSTQSSQRPEPATFHFRIGGKPYAMSYPQAFAYGHRLLKVRQVEVAAAIFEKLTHVTDRGPRANIMFAICLAGLGNYKESHDALDRAFAGEECALAAQLQDIVVMARMGFKRDAMKELVALVNTHQELPTLCLWLGDMLETNLKLDQALQCWQLAIRRDRPGGAVALAATKQLQRHGQSPKFRKNRPMDI
jgi:hypothetical protein